MKLKQIGPNQTEIQMSDALTVFFSYETPVACYVAGPVQAISGNAGGLRSSVPIPIGYYHTSQRWSRTTTRHIARWLGPAILHAAPRPQAFFDNLETK